MGRVVLQFFVAVAVAVLAALVYSFRDMKLKTARSILLLQEEMEETVPVLSPERQQEEFNKLPPVVQYYLVKTLPDMDKNNVASVKRVKSLKLKQKGTIRMDQHWVPFTATQFFSAALENIGFVWDATVFMAEPIPTYFSSAVHLDLAFLVQDTYVRGKGLLEARLLGVVPVAHLENNPDINAGELMRWLAESLMFPTVLLPTHEGGVKWSPAADMDPLKARLSIGDPRNKQTKVSLTVHFNETSGLPFSLVGMRAKADTGKYAEPGSFSYTRWEGVVGEYTTIEGMVVPTHFDAGWWEGKKLELYFKGENYDVEYDYF